ncbi:MAG: gliding motility-associated C-terminal domain-containing protein [Bacteroidetes bacterium]|nr:gliding motility-associated C-terminal domain-containing protein [Bacteroidota bacterium]
MIKFSKLLCCFLASLLILSNEVLATHIRASEIIIRRISSTSLTYEITVIGYRDTGSDILFGGGDLDIDGREEPYTDFDVTEIDLGNEISYNFFKVIHEFPGPGIYKIKYREENRNEGILNMFNSVETPFYVEAEIVIDPFFGLNNSPILLVPPIDEGAVGSQFIHNPGAFDPDGDSLAYCLTIPRQSTDSTVFAYSDPNAPQFYGDYSKGNETEDGPPTFSINDLTGDLTWNAPGKEGEYNVAFIVKEFRKISGIWFQLGFVVRDMQIIIKDSENERPEIMVPPDLCVEAGTKIEEIIRAEDPEGDPVKLEAFGGPFEMISSPAEYQPFPPIFQDSPGFMPFEWQTNCSHIRQAPYDIQIKASDKPGPNRGPSLVEFATWKIQVVAPRPQGLTTTLLPGKAIQLNWDNYECSNAANMQIWRRVDMFEIPEDSCLTGMPAYTGYELIDVIDVSTTSYLDNNKGFGLAPGANYCYRLVAEFAAPTGGESFVSAESCRIILADAPVVTNVDVIATDENDGEILVKWMEPFEIDEALFPPPYTYEVFRSVGFSGGGRVSLGQTSDTVWTDTQLNTLRNPYSYQIDLFDANGDLVDTSAVASSVRLETTPLVKAIELSWEANVPWSNNIQDFPNHYLFRDHTNPTNPSELNQIADVNVNINGFLYLDDGSFNGQELDDDIVYCYYVTTQGSYGNTAIDEPLINNSQIGCSQPNDEIPPCMPVAFRFEDAFNCSNFLADQACSFGDFSNTLQWEENIASECDDDVRSFNIYFSDTGEESDFELVGNVTLTEFTHENLPSFKGCYKISAVDRSGNESELTEAVCHDNCPFFQLPNVFTPNGDNINDLFVPYAESDGSNSDRSLCPRFVESVTLQLFDRNGNKVYDYFSKDNPETSIFIEWTGQTSSGTELPAGVYYYVADIIFDVLNPEDAKEQLTGFVHILK